MSKLTNRKSVDVNINAPKDRHIPVFDLQTRLWYTVDYQDITSGSIISKITSGSVTASVDPAYGFKVNSKATISGSTLISGSLIVTGSFSALSNGTQVNFNGDPFSMTRLGNTLNIYAANGASSNYSTISSNSNLLFIGNMGQYIALPSSIYNGVGINTTTPQALLDVNGSGRYTGGLTVTGSLNVSGSITTTGTITAQTLVVQTITSSTVYSSGSNIFGNSLANTQTFTGSVGITGSLSVIGPSIFSGVVSGSQPANNPSSSIISIDGSINAPASGASAVFLNTIMSASANNQTLVGLDVYPTFNTGSFTSIKTIGTRIYGTSVNPATILSGSILRLQSATGSNVAQNGQPWLDLVDNTGTTLFNLYTHNQGSNNSLTFSSTKHVTITSLNSVTIYQPANNTGRLNLGSGTSGVNGEGTLAAADNLLFAVNNGGAQLGGGTTMQKIFTSGSVVFQNGGTFVDNGYKVQINGSGSLSGSLYVNGYTVHDGTISGSQPANNPSSSLILISGSIIPTGSVSGASAVLLNTIMSASANNQTLVGLDIYPAYNTGSFTGVKTIGTRIYGTSANIGTASGSILRLQAATGSNTAANGQLWIDGVDNTGTTLFNLYTGTAGASNNSLTFGSIKPIIFAVTGSVTMYNTSNNTGKLILGSGAAGVNGEGTLQAADNLLFNAGTTTMQKIFTSGSVVFQTGGTFTDNGYKVQVNGSGSLSGSLFVSGSTSLSGSVNISNSLLVGSGGSTMFYNSDPFQLTRLGNTLSIYAANGSYGNYSLMNSSGNFIIKGPGASWSNTNSIFFPANSNLIGINTFSPQYNLDVSGSGRYTDGLIVTGSVNVSGNITTTGTLTAQTLVVQTITSSTVYSSGSNIFGNDITNTQQFTGSMLVTGSITVATPVINNLTASYAVSASQAITASYVLASNVVGLNLSQIASGSVTASVDPTTGFKVNSNATVSGSLTITGSSYSFNNTLNTYFITSSAPSGSNVIFSQPTGSYTSAFFKYTISSGSNARAGEVISVWNSTTSSYTDYTTTDIGNTSTVTSLVSISGNNVVYTVSSSNGGWTIKSLVVYI